MNRRKRQLCSVKICLIALLCFAGSAFAAPSGYWFLNDAQDGPYDDILDQNDINDGTCDTGCPTFSSTGAVGESQTFDGVDDAIIVSPSAAGNKFFDWADVDDFSIEVWFNPSADTLPADETQVIIGRDDHLNGHLLHWWIGIRNVGGNGTRVAARLVDQEGDGSDGVPYLLTASDDDFTPVPAGTWHQAVMVKNGTTVSLYVDGALEASQTVDYTTVQTSTAFVSTSAPLCLGYLYITRATPLRGFYFAGGIDQVALHNDPLDADAVLASYNSGSAGQYTEFAPVFTTTDFGMSALGYEFIANAEATAYPAISEYTLGPNAPEGLLLDTTTGDMNWMPTNEQVGINTINVSATNTAGTTSQDLTVEIVDACASLDAYFNLDETQAPFDSQVGTDDTHDAVCAAGGCPTVDAAPKVNSALAFDGSTQGLDVAASAGMDRVFDWTAAESFTISFFMKRDPASFSDGETEVIISRAITDTAEWWIGLRDDAGGAVTPRLFARLEANNGDGHAIAITDALSPGTVADGNWHHVALVHNDEHNTVSLYLDGVLEASQTIAYAADASFANATTPLAIGYSGSSNNFFFGGSLDEIAFFGTALEGVILRQHATQNEGRGYCNDMPVITSTPATAVNAGETYIYEPTVAADAEGDNYTWSLATSPEGMSIDERTGRIEWTAVANGSDPVPVTLVVNDGHGGTASQSFDITVITADSDSPTITGQESLSTKVDTPITIELTDLVVSDPTSTYPDGYTLTLFEGTNYTISGQTVTPSTGFTGTLSVLATITKGATTSPAYTLSIEVTDNGGGGGGSGGGGGGGGGCFIDSIAH